MDSGEKMTNNLEYYKVFYYVAKQASVSGAAKILNISQPAVSQAIKHLEESLSTRLFFRNAKGVELTEAGRVLFSYVSKGYEMMEKGEKKVAELLNMEAGEVHIGASDMTLKYCLLPYLEKFNEKYPGIKVAVTNAPTPDTLRLLKEGAIDFGVVSTPFEINDETERINVREIQDIFVAGRKFISLKNKTLDFSELNQFPLICLEKNTSTRQYVDSVLNTVGVELTPEFELATSDMIVQFALRSLGIGCVVSEFAKEEIERGRLFELRFNSLIPKRNICIVRNPKRMPSIAAANLMKLIHKEL